MSCVSYQIKYLYHKPHIDHNPCTMIVPVCSHCLVTNTLSSTAWLCVLSMPHGEPLSLGHNQLHGLEQLSPGGVRVVLARQDRQAIPDLSAEHCQGWENLVTVSIVFININIQRPNWSTVVSDKVLPSCGHL